MRVRGGFMFDHRYREQLALPDGTTATLRLLRADDKELLRRGFEQLSDDSRYNRFFAGKRTLLDSELRYLTEIDQRDHFALVAVRTTARGEEGLGVARAVRLRLEPEVYEGAITVVDAWQRRGLGTSLTRRLLWATRERGATRLRLCVLPSNVSMKALLVRVAPDAVTGTEDGILRFDIPLCDGRARALSA
jgi:ribosomal protein S18 acetylase RimI-like enzyme